MFPSYFPLHVFVSVTASALVKSPSRVWIIISVISFSRDHEACIARPPKWLHTAGVCHRLFWLIDQKKRVEKLKGKSNLSLQHTSYLSHQSSYFSYFFLSCELIIYLIFMCFSKLPSWARAVVPKIFYVTEKAWNYYPYTITGNTLIVHQHSLL